VVCALLASLCYALASVLQHRAAITQPDHHSLRLGLLGRLVRHPQWVVGIACDGLGFALQFVALGHGSLVLVQPLLVCGLLFALPLGAWLAGTGMEARDWIGAVVVVAGLSVFLVVAAPGRGHADVDSWPLLIAAVGVTTGVILVAARGRSKRARAALLATGAAVIYGLSAALTKAVAHQLGADVVKMLSSWEVYTLVVVGVIGMVLAQSAFQSGPLDASLPMLTVVDPVASIAIGALGLGEGIRTGIAPSTLETLGLVLMTVGVFMLSRSEAAHVAQEERVRDDGERDRRAALEEPLPPGDG